MSNMFSELKDLGFNNIDNIEIFEEEVVEKKKNVLENNKTENNYLFDRHLTCPVCNGEFKSRSLRTGKIKLLRTDLDLRPIYNILDPIKYDVIVCNICGYAAISKLFKKITSTQKKILREKISSQYMSREYPQVYSYEVAIERYKLALYDSIVIKAKNSEKAYYCLKIAWLYRGMIEEKQKIDTYDEEKISQYKISELQFLKYAYEGFEKAYQSERFPTLGLDEITIEYLLGELSRRIGNYEESLKWIGKILISRNASNRLKDKARECKSLIKESLNK